MELRAVKDANPAMGENGKVNPLRAMALASSISVEIAAGTVIGYYSGKWLDSKLGTDPWLMIVGLLLGLAGGMWGIVVTLEAFNKNDKG